MKKTIVKIIGITISLILISQNIAVYAESTNELKNQQSEINDKIDEIEQRQKEVEANKSEAMKSVENLIYQISDVENEIKELEGKVEELKTQISSRKKDIEEKQEEYNKQEELLDARMVALYKSGKTSYLDILLTASSMTDFLDKFYMAQELMECDKDFMQQVSDEKKVLEDEKAKLEADKKELDTSVIQQKAKETSLKQMKDEKEKYVEKLTAEEKELQEEIEELEKENKKIAEEIKQAEIRYQKQLEELKRQQQQNNSGSSSTGSGYFIRPVSSGTITTNGYYSSSGKFHGKFHGAIDYGVPVGTTVVAAADGVVMLTANLTTSYGTHVVIRHANGMQTYYAHGTRGSIVVSPGQTVKQGQKIMLSGNTGNSSGPHLHFEVRVSPYTYRGSATAYGQDCRVDPSKYM